MNPIKLNIFSNVDAQSLSTANKPLHALYDTLTAEIARATGASHARLLAEPVADGDGGTIDWYGPAGAEAARPFGQLSAEEQVRARRSLKTIVDDLNAAAQAEGGSFARMIETVLQVPSADDVLAFGDQVLLVRWGMNSGVPGSVPDPVGEIVSAPVPANELGDSSKQAPVAPSSRPYTVPPPEVPSNRKWLPGAGAATLSATVTVVLLLVSGLLLLQNCGLALPTFLTGGNRVALFNFCAAVSPGEDLTAAYIRRMETDLDRQVAACTPGEISRERATDEEVSGRDIDERQETQGIVSGALGITLAWNGTSDLDLHVVCPGGEKISHTARSACQGKLQLDMNAGQNSSETPIENIFWEEDNIPPGTYQVHVSCYRPRPVCDNTGIPYTVEVHNRGGSAIARFSGTTTKKVQSKPLPQDPTFAGSFTIP